MEYLDDLTIVRTPPVTLARWQALVARRGDFSLPDQYAGCRIYLNDLEFDAGGMYVWLGHSSGQHIPVHFSSDHLYIPGIDGETVVFAQNLALELDACLIHKVHPMNVSALDATAVPA